MASKDKILATFRVDPSKWEVFKTLATAEGSNASAVFTEFLEWYLAGNRINAADTPPPYTSSPIHLDNLDDKIDERIEVRLGDLRSQLEELAGK